MNQCSNCGQLDQTHIAMYCDQEPQKILRCADQKCWAAARSQADHHWRCNIKENCIELDANDPIHDEVMRFQIISEKEPIKRYDVGSSIANNIDLEWKNEKCFEIYGPGTMNFRVLLAVEEQIVGRFDVGNLKTDFLTFDLPPDLDHVNDASEIDQTAAILVVAEADVIYVKTDRIFRLQFERNGRYFHLVKYDTPITNGNL